MKKITIIIILIFFSGCTYFYKDKYKVVSIFEPILIKHNEYILILVEQDIQDPYGPNTFFGFVDGYRKYSNSVMKICHYNDQTHSKNILQQTGLDKINGINNNIKSIMPIVRTNTSEIFVNFYYCGTNYKPIESFLSLSYSISKNTLQSTHEINIQNDYSEIENHVDYIKSNLKYIIEKPRLFKEIIIKERYYDLMKLSTDGVAWYSVNWYNHFGHSEKHVIIKQLFGGDHDKET